MNDHESRHFLDETVVAALYRGLLGRAPDPEGFKWNLAALRKIDGTDVDLATYISSYLDSNECRDRQSRLLLNRLSIHNPSPSHNAIANVVSFGSHCLTSVALKEMGLKKESYPFDWIFSNLRMVEHCIEDNFDKFLDSKYYEPLHGRDDSVIDNKCEHTFYRDVFGVHSIFNHMDVRIDNHYQYISRCVSRFRALLSSKSKKYFICAANAQGVDNAQISRLHSLLQRITDNYMVVIVFVDISDTYKGSIGFNVSEYNSNLIIARMHSFAGMGPLTFNDPIDDLLFRRLLFSIINAESDQTAS